MEKGNKILTIILFFVFLLIGGIIGYTANDLLDNSKNQNNTNVPNNEEKNKDEYPTINQVAYKDEYFVVKYGQTNIQQEIEYTINGNYIGKAASLTDIKNIDNKYLIVDTGGGHNSDIYNSDGTLAFNVNGFDQKNIKYENNELTIIYVEENTFYETSDYAGALCKEKDTNKIILKTITYKLESNGTAKEIKRDDKSPEDIVKGRFNVSCKELKETTDESLQFQKELATN